MMNSKFVTAGRILGTTGVVLSTIQLSNSNTEEDFILNTFDLLIGGAGVICPSYLGIPSTIWFFGGKQLSIWYSENILTPMIEAGINPGIIINQPFK